MNIILSAAKKVHFHPTALLQPAPTIAPKSAFALPLNGKFQPQPSPREPTVPC